MELAQQAFADRQLHTSLWASAGAAIAVASAVILGGCTSAQQSSNGLMMHGIVTVTEVDAARRIAHFRGPNSKGAVVLPPGMQAADIRPGSRYRVVYEEPVAVSIRSGARPQAGSVAVLEAEPGASAGSGVRLAETGGVLQSISPAARRITVRTLEGNEQTFRLAEDTRIDRTLKPGDAMTVAYNQALALQIVSTPQPERDPVPAP